MPAGIYPEGVIKYKCVSRGYTAWWQRKLYFTFLTAYILVIPVIFMTYCYINVVLVVWKRSRELSTSRVPTIHVHEEETGEIGSRRRRETNLPVRSHSDYVSHRFRRFRVRGTTGSEQAGDIEMQLRSPEADRVSARTGNVFSRLPCRWPSAVGRTGPFRRHRRTATESECTSSQSRSPEPGEFETETETGTGSRSLPTTPPRLRRAAFNVAAMSRARVRTIQMTLCIVCSFVACWTPYFTVHLIHIWSEYRYKMPEIVYVIAETMALVNSAINPLLYACFNASTSCCRCRRSPADHIRLERVELHNDRSHASLFSSTTASDGRRTYRRAVSGPSTWFGHSVNNGLSTRTRAQRARHFGGASQSLM